MFSDLADYYLRWYHSRPVAITPARRDELRRLHRILYRCIEYFVLHYEEYVPRYMPLGEREMEILALQSRYPFRAGTYRPDYLISKEGELKICEITSRFFAHGIFLTWFGELAADRFLSRFPEAHRESRYGELIDCLLGLAEGRRRIYVFKSADRTSAIRLYKRFYEAHGHTVTVLEAEEVERCRREWSRNAFLVSALNQQDLLRYSTDTLRAMMDAGMYSDFRTILLVHDKRFMRLWFEDSFTDRCLSEADAAFLRTHSIRTFVCADPDATEMLRDAYTGKDRYILKPCRLGKSEGVHAGPLTSRAEWQRLWTDGLDGMVLQPFLRQRTYPTVWEDTAFEDYLCGMMLCVDSRYFDSGIFRASSLPVTNIGDDRKACALHTDSPELLPYCDML